MGNGFFGLPKDERSKDSVQRRTPETETPVDLMPTSEGVAPDDQARGGVWKISKYDFCHHHVRFSELSIVATDSMIKLD